jgi:hypothetical protein
LSASWLLAYATVGGLTNVVAFFAGIQVFRATNRVAIFISALVLIFLMGRLSRLTMNWSAGWRITAAMALAAFGLFDQIPRRLPGDARARMKADVKSDLALGREVEAALPPRAMLFQLPVLGFPEVQPPFRLVDYEHFRLYLTTGDLRFSYGAAKFRARSRWQREMENLPLETLVRRLESYGFDALYINRKGYEDRAEALLAELAKLGYDRRLQGAHGEQVVVRLNPSPEPVLPLARELTYGRGWHPRPEDGVRWANDDAVLSYYNPHAKPLSCELRFELIGVSSREVILNHNGYRVQSVQTHDEPVQMLVPRLELAPGVNCFRLHSPEPAMRLSTGRYALRTFGLKASTIRIHAGAEPASGGAWNVLRNDGRSDAAIER